MHKILSAIVLLAAIALAASLASAQDVANGQRTYNAKCASCHGPDGKGQTAAGKTTKVRDFHWDEVKKESDAVWTEIIVKGKNGMPGYDHRLSDAEVKDVLAYIRTLVK
ncbi:MAG TPA: cytochrome c [Terriglobales bacterium]|nr:cytochrome c [Terriglobales bacterium]